MQTEQRYKLLRAALDLARTADYGSDPRSVGMLAAWNLLAPDERDCLRQLVNEGPVFDGDILSKSARDDLIDYGLAVRCCVKGEQGYAAATYPAFPLLKFAEEHNLSPVILKQRPPRFKQPTGGAAVEGGATGDGGAGPMGFGSR